MVKKETFTVEMTDLRSSLIKHIENGGFEAGLMAFKTFVRLFQSEHA